VSSTGGFDEPIIMRMQMAGTALFVSDAEAMTAALESLRAQMEALTAASEANTAAVTAQGAATAAASAGVVKSVKKPASALAALRGGLKSTGGALKTVGGTLTKYVTLPLVALGTVAIKSSMNFKSAMLTIQTEAGKGAKQVAVMTKTVLALGKAGSVFTPQELALSAAQIEKVGFTGKRGIAILKAANMAGQVGKTDVETMASVIAGVKTVEMKGTQDPKRIGAQIVAAAGAGGTTTTALLKGYGTGILAAAKNFGITFNQLNAMIALAADEHTLPSFTGARLRTALAFIATPNPTKATPALASIGLSRFELSRQLADAKGGGMVHALTTLHNALLGVKDPSYRKQILADIFPGGRGAILIQLMNQLYRLKPKEAQIARTSSPAYFASSYAKSNENAQVRLEKATNKVKTSFVELGLVLTPIIIPALIKLLGYASEAIHWFTKLSPTTRKWVVVLLLVAAALGPLLVMIGTFMVLLSFGLGPIALIVIGLIAVALACVFLYTHFKVVQEVVGWVLDHWQYMALLFATPFVGLVTAGLFVVKYWGSIEKFFSGLFGRIGKIAQGFINIIRHLLSLLHLGGSTIGRNPKSLKATQTTFEGIARTNPAISAAQYDKIDAYDRAHGIGYVTVPIHVHAGGKEIAKVVATAALQSRAHH
jgi:hypothetical protein